MQLERRRSIKKPNTRDNSDLKIEANFSTAVLNLFCSYVVSENKNIKRSSLIQLRKLFSLLNYEKYYSNDPDKMEQINFINKALISRLDKNLHNSSIIIADIYNGFEVCSNIVDSLKKISNEDIDWICNLITSTLNYSYVDSMILEYSNIIERYRTCDYSEKPTIAQEFKELTNKSQATFRHNQTESQSMIMFNLEKESFESAISDSYDRQSNPNNVLKTCMQGMNELLGGGFESERVYFLFGLPGEGKSMTLLDLAYQIKMANTDFVPNDPTKIPAVLYISMENGMDETIGRFFSISVSDEKMTNYTKNDVIRLFRTKGELSLSESSPINIFIAYIPGNSIDVGYLYDLVDNLNDDGYEVIAVIQDYIKKIRPVKYTGDSRLDLGNCSEEFKNFAVNKHLVMISASQLNRDATRHIDDARKATKSDLVRLLGRSNIGESSLMLENVDGAFLIAPEYNYETKQKYLGIQRIKKRYDASNREYIYQPYEEENNARLVHDLYCAQPAFKDTLKPDVGYGLAPGFVQNSPYQINDIKDLGDAKLIGDSNSRFESLNTISSEIDEDEFQLYNPNNVMINQQSSQQMYNSSNYC